MLRVTPDMVILWGKAKKISQGSSKVSLTLVRLGFKLSVWGGCGLRRCLMAKAGMAVIVMQQRSDLTLGLFLIGKYKIL